MNDRAHVVEQRVFNAVPAGARQARQFVAAAMLRRSAPDAVVGDYRLMVSELASNLIEHGVGSELIVIINDSDPPWWEIEVVGRVDEDTIVLPPPQKWQVADGQQVSGRGLGILRTLADDIIVGIGDHVLSVRCRRRKTII